MRDSALWVVEEGVDEVVKGEVDMDAGKSNEKKSFLYDMLSLKVPGNLCYRGAQMTIMFLTPRLLESGPGFS